MKTLSLFSCPAVAASIGLLLFTPAAARAVTILQTPSSTAIAWEAEKYGTFLDDPFTAPAPPRVFWTPTNNVDSSGGAALYIFSPTGANITSNAISYVDYRLQFATPGSYKFYYRWKADVVWASGDRFTANSFYAPKTFNAPTAPDNPSTLAAYNTSASNTGTDAQANPSSTNYSVFSEPVTFEVSQAMVDTREVVVLRLGTRERGMFIDRIVLSTDQALNEAGFNAIPNSDVDVFVQPSGATHIAFEAETRKASFLNDPFTAPAPPRVFWTPTNNVDSSGGAALYIFSPTGANITSNAISYVDYRLQFTTPGAYKFYYRWKADVVWASGDRFTANSFYAPKTFNAPTAPDNPSTLAAYNTSTSNTGTDAQANPSSTNYSVFSEPVTFEVSQTMVDTREVVVLRLGTRERGMFIDRIVLSTDQALNEAGFNALPNTALDNTPPQVVNVSPSITFTSVVITFNEAISPASIDLFDFSISGDLAIGSIPVLDATLRKLTIQTSQQTPGTVYTITYSSLADVSGNVVPPNSQVSFESWRLQTGWVSRDIYAAINGATVADLVASPKYPDNSDSMDSALGVAMVNNPRANNYGMRIRFFFAPAATDMYDFYVYADDQAEVFLSTDESAANLVSVVNSAGATSGYDPNIKGTIPLQEFVAGQRYLVQVLYKQASGEGRLGVAVAGQSVAAAQGLPPLSELAGSLISTYINPATASVSITANPQNTSVTVGQSARFTAAATSPAGALSYQWQVDGVDIPGANRPAYTTPALSFADGNKRYRVIVRAGGATATSSEARVTINAGQPPTALPYVGINFVGGGGSTEGFLSATDITGAVPQANFNNVQGGAQTLAPLLDANGNPSPVAVTFNAFIRYTGAGNVTADDALFEGYIQNNNAPTTIIVAGVPPGNYGLLVYSVGFDFQTIYDQAYQLIGAATYPTFHVRAQAGGQYRASPGYHRMSSTDPNARDSGNYVMFENVSPDGSGNLTLNMTPEPPATPGVGDAMPAVNAMQLVRIVPPLPVLGIVYTGNGMPNVAVIVTWDANATGYRLKSTASLGPSPAPVWSLVSGSPDPITGAGAVTLNATGNLYFRLEK